MAVDRGKRETKTQRRQPKPDTSDRKTRISSACQACKKRKTRCSGLPSPCTACQYVGAHCHFNLRLDTRRKNSYTPSAVQEHQRAILDSLLQVLKHSNVQSIETLLQLIRNENHPDEIIKCLMQNFTSLQLKGILPQLKFDEYDLMALGLQSLSSEPFTRRVSSPERVHLRNLDGLSSGAEHSSESEPSTSAEQSLHAPSYPFTPPYGFLHPDFAMVPQFCSNNDGTKVHDNAIEPSTQDAHLPIYSTSPTSMSSPSRLVDGEPRGSSEVIDPGRTSSAIAPHSSHQTARGLLSIDGNGSDGHPLPRLNTSHRPPEYHGHVDFPGCLTPISPRTSKARTNSMRVQVSMSEDSLQNHRPPASSFMSGQFTDAVGQNKSNLHLSSAQAAQTPYCQPHLPIHSRYMLPSNASAEDFIDLHAYQHAYQSQLLSRPFSSGHDLHGPQPTPLVRAAWDPTLCPAGFSQVLEM